MVGDAEGDGFGELVLLGWRYEGGFQDEAEGEVFARLGSPVVAPLADAGGLLAGADNGELLGLREVEEFAILVCRG